MSVTLLGVTTLAFLFPAPAERPALPDPPRGTGWAIAAVAVFLGLVTLVPLSLALADKWMMEAHAAECRAKGGRIVHASADGRAYRCEPATP
ncbi:hypothetical protein [Methylobacterium gossipiicola]|uniref:Uncharacterized protein n=1 Tax=Methylobacterium gossipiicola TaxID=582675 RepID=A0A1I2S3N5_9HYPH|nr:hypothetical protein [Methylobacterium gossipiicola]SFG47418.1 hypothetical protein SAMN05192565_1048 [Methylobacterium gossipiicola]